MNAGVDQTRVAGVTVLGADDGTVLTPAALSLVADLERRFGARRVGLLAERAERQARIDAGESLDFLPQTADVRSGDWTVAPPPPALRDRRVEITGPTDAKMVINALNSGANGFMADFEDANTPTWDNILSGQANLAAAVAGRLEFRAPDGREYRVRPDPATLLVRPRGWHMTDRHVLIDGREVSGALLDVGLFAAANARTLAARGAGPFLYLPKLQGHREARLWNDVLSAVEDGVGIDRGTIRATVLIETIPAAFEMDEILYELREHSAGLNAGRWDYLFSVIKTFRARPATVLPDRNTVAMTVPFMRAYADLLVATCHRRGAHAMGGMAAFIPSRRDPQGTERALAAVAQDKRREASAGFDGTWVAHPGLVATARQQFDDVLGDRANQVDSGPAAVQVGAAELLDLASAGGQPTDQGLRSDVSVAIRYLTAWLGGSGAVAINNLMEDVATAEIARAQVWQWVSHGVRLSSGRLVTAELVRQLAAEELAALRGELGDEGFAGSRAEDALQVFEQVALADQLPDFLTQVAYPLLE